MKSEDDVSARRCWGQRRRMKEQKKKAMMHVGKAQNAPSDGQTPTNPVQSPQISEVGLEIYKIIFENEGH